MSSNGQGPAVGRKRGDNKRNLCYLRGPPAVGYNRRGEAKGKMCYPRESLGFHQRRKQKRGAGKDTTEGGVRGINLISAKIERGMEGRKLKCMKVVRGYP